jgi:type II pantothenate kinase
MPLSPEILGLDLGATLAKLALQRDALHTEHLPARDLDAVRARVTQLSPRRIVATGAGADALGASIEGIPVEHVAEFEAWALGAPVVAAEEGAQLPERYLVVSLGTGTSVLAVNGSSAMRVGGTGLGGGTLLGLGRLLVGAPSFEQLTALAARGDRRKVDLLVGDIYRGDSPLPGDLTASNFAKLGSSDPADIAHALVGMVGENVALVCAHLARLTNAEAVVMGGSTLEGHATLRRVLEETLALLGLEARFLARGGYCGAVGAAMAGAARPG